MKLTFDRIVILLTSTFVLAVLVLLYGLWLHPLFKVMVGYSAQTACQQHFIAQREPRFTYQRELSGATAAPTEIKNNNKVIATTPYLPLYSSFSVFIPQVGCVLGWEDPKSKSKKNDDEYSYDEEENFELKDYSFQTNYPPIAAQKLPRRINRAAQKIAEAYVAKKALFTRGFVVFHKGAIIAEVYGDGAKPSTPHQGWSMTKSLLHAVYGVAIQKNLINVEASPSVALWQSINDKRNKITFDELFRMSSGLAFDETYGGASAVTEMLFTKKNSGYFAAQYFLENRREKRWHYSSGTSNILSWIYTKEMRKKNKDPLGFMRDNLFKPLGMSSMVVSPDFVGTPVASSFGFATTEDWLKLGVLYLQKGRWQGKQLVPAAWVEKAARSITKGSKGKYSHHWWLNDPESKFVREYPSVPRDAYWAGGFNGQTVMVIPSREMVVARVGWTVGGKTQLDEVLAELLAIKKSIRK